MFGGFSFFLLKGLLKLYYKQQQYRRQVQRTVLDFEEANRQEELRGDARNAWETLGVVAFPKSQAVGTDGGMMAHEWLLYIELAFDESLFSYVIDY